MKSEEDEDKKVRKTIINGSISYYLIIKRKNNNKEEIKTNKIISKIEYLHYLSKRDETLEPVIKIRYSFRYGKEVYNLDIFNNSKWGILENGTSKHIDDLELPNFLNVVSLEENIDLNNKKTANKKVKTLFQTYN